MRCRLRREATKDRYDEPRNFSAENKKISESDIYNLSAMIADEKEMEFSVNGPMSKSQNLEFINWCQSGK